MKQEMLLMYTAFGLDEDEDYTFPNALLSESGHPALDSLRMQGGRGGGGVTVYRGRTVVDVCGSGSGGEQTIYGYQQSAGRGSGHWGLGWLLLNTRLLRVFPMVGVGGFGGGLESQKTESSQEKISLGGGGALLHCGIGIDVTVPLGRAQLVFGVRMGYRLPLFMAGDEHMVRGKRAYANGITGLGWKLHKSEAAPERDGSP